MKIPVFGVSRSLLLDMNYSECTIQHETRLYTDNEHYSAQKVIILHGKDSLGVIE
jgi:hypothetical protein